MKVRNYRILLTIWIGLILFLLGQFLYGCLFQTVYPTLLDKLYAITSFLWKYFLSILAMSLFVLIQPLDSINEESIKTKEEEKEKEVLMDSSPETTVGLPISNRNKAIIVIIMLILAFFLIRHVVFVNFSNVNLIVWNFIYVHIFVFVTSATCLILLLINYYKMGKKMEKTDEI